MLDAHRGDDDNLYDYDHSQDDDYDGGAADHEYDHHNDPPAGGDHDNLDDNVFHDDRAHVHFDEHDYYYYYYDLGYRAPYLEVTPCPMP